MHVSPSYAYRKIWCVEGRGTLLLACRVQAFVCGACLRVLHCNVRKCMCRCFDYWYCIIVMLTRRCSLPVRSSYKYMYMYTHICNYKYTNTCTVCTCVLVREHVRCTCIVVIVERPFLVLAGCASLCMQHIPEADGRAFS